MGERQGRAWKTIGAGSTGAGYGQNPIACYGGFGRYTAPRRKRCNGKDAHREVIRRRCGDRVKLSKAILEDRRSPTQLGFQEINTAQAVLCLLQDAGGPASDGIHTASRLQGIAAERGRLPADATRSR